MNIGLFFAGLASGAFMVMMLDFFLANSKICFWIRKRTFTNTVKIDINTINKPISTAPGVYMNGGDVNNSSAFLYKSRSGKSYLSIDTGIQKNGGAFYEVISNTATEIVVSSIRQTDILYTDLKNGGFFEYNSSNYNHTSVMQIMMNTETATETTRYACNIKNANNNFITDWSFGNGLQITSFSSITENWHTGNAFRYDLENNNANSDLTDKTIIIVAGKAFRGAWIPSPWKNTSIYQLMMNTDKVTSATNYLLLHSHSNNQKDGYISTDGLKYTKIDLTTGKLTATTINYDYKTGVVPTINP